MFCNCHCPKYRKYTQLNHLLVFIEIGMLKLIALATVPNIIKMTVSLIPFSEKENGGKEINHYNKYPIS